MANVCQTCGVPGFEETLVFCSVCKTSAEHRYCMFVIPTVMDVDVLIWTCEDCSPTFPRVNLPYKDILNRSWEEGLEITLSQNSYDGDYEYNPSGMLNVQDSDEPYVIDFGAQSCDDKYSTVLESLSDVKLEAACRSMPSPRWNTSTNSNCLKKIRKKTTLDDQNKKDEEILQSSNAVLGPSKMKGKLSIPDSFSNENNLSMSFGKISSDFDICLLKSNSVNEKGESNINEENQVDSSISIENEESLKWKRRRIIIDDDWLDQGDSKMMVVKKGSLEVASQDFDKNDPNHKTKSSVNIGSTDSLKRKGQIFDKDQMIVFKNNSPQRVSLQTSGSISANSELNRGMTVENMKLLLSNTQRLILDKANCNEEDLETLPNVESMIDSEEEKFMPYEAVHVNDVALDHSLIQETFNNDIKRISSEISSCFPSNVDVLPIKEPVWSGFFSILKELNIQVAAHLSNRACKRVHSEAKTLPLRLSLERKSKKQYWAETFTQAALTDDNIGLYFFPSNVSECSKYEQILEEVIRDDIMLNAVLDEAELIILPSIDLPLSNKFFEGKVYLWGVFKRKKTSISAPTSSKATLHRCTMPCLELTAKVSALCRDMNSDGFWQLIVKSPKTKVEELHSELPSLLQQCVDPFRFVVDCISAVFPLNTLKGEKHEWVCLLLLKSLASSMRISGSLSSSLLSSVSTRNEARKIADLWKAANISSVRSHLPYARTFLLHVVTFNIATKEDAELYRNLLMYFFWDEKISELVIPLGLDRKTVIGMVKTLIGKGREIHALPFIYHAKLADKFHPLPLLKCGLTELLADISWQYRGGKKISKLYVIMDYVGRFKLEKEIPLKPLKVLINMLKNKINVRSMSITKLNKKIGKLKDELLFYCSTETVKPTRKHSFREAIKRKRTPVSTPQLVD